MKEATFKRKYQVILAFSVSSEWKMYILSLIRTNNLSREIPTTTSIIPCSTRPRRKSFEARITAFLVASALSGTLCKIHYNLFNIVEKYTDFVVINCLLLSTTIMFALDLLFDYLVCKGQWDSNDEEEEREHKICKSHAVPRWVSDGRNKATNIIHNDHKLSFLHGDHILSEFYSAMKYIN